MPVVTTAYAVTGTDSHGCVSSTTATITVNPLPNLSIVSSSSTVCAGQSSLLQVSGALSYLWSTGFSSSSLTVMPAVTTAYVVTGTDSHGCVSSTTATITVNPLPNLSIVSSSSTVCAGQSSLLQSSGALSYLWSTGSSSASLTVTPFVTTAYSVTGTDSQACSAVAVITLTVNPLPKMSIFTYNSTICCSGENVYLSASGASKYWWTTTHENQNLYPSSVIEDSDNGKANIVVRPCLTAVYKVLGTDDNGCVGQDEIAVVVNSKAISIATIDPLPIVRGKIAYIRGSGFVKPIAVAVYDYANEFPVTAEVVDSITIKCDFTNVPLIIAALKVTNGYGKIARTSVIIHPQFTLTSSINPPMLYGDSYVDLSFTSEEPKRDVWFDYQWYKDGVAIVSATNMVYRVTEPGEYYLQRQLSGGVLSSTNKIIVSRLPILTKPLITSNVSVMQLGETVTLTTISDYRNQIKWYKNNALWSEGSSTTLTVLSCGYYKVSFTNPLGWSVESDPFVLHSPFTVTSTGLPYLYDNGAVTLTIVSNDGAMDNLYSYQWYKNGEVMATATRSTLVTKELGHYSAVRTLYGSSLGSINSLEVKQLPKFIKPVLAGNKTMLHEGDTVMLLASNLLDENRVRWYNQQQSLQYCEPQEILNLSENLIRNGDFEGYSFSGSWENAPATAQNNKSWTTNNGGLEIQRVFFGADKYLEIDANGPNSYDMVGQDVKTVKGVRYNLEFDYCPRPNTLIGTNGFEVYFNHKLLATILPKGGNYTWKHFAYQVESDVEDNRVEFRELLSGDDSYGALIDNVALRGASTSYVRCDSVYKTTKSGIYRLVASNRLGVESVSNDVIVHPYFNITATTLPYVYQASSVTLTVVSHDHSMDAVYEHQWYKDGVAIAGAKQVSYLATEEGDYTLVRSLLGKILFSPDSVHITRLPVLSTPTVEEVDNDMGDRENCSTVLAVLSPYGNRVDWYRNGTLVSTCDPQVELVPAKELVVNGDFDGYPLGTNSWGNFPARATNGAWQSSVGGIEIQRIFDGSNPYMELDANRNSVDRIWQNIKTVKGGVYTLSFNYAPRPDKLAENSSTVEVYFNSKLLATIKPANQTFAWKNYSYRVVSELEDNKIEFRELASEDNGYGGLIDHVSLAGAAYRFLTCDYTYNTNCKAGIYQSVLTNKLGVSTQGEKIVLNKSFGITSTTLPYLYAHDAVVTLTLVDVDAEMDTMYRYQWYKYNQPIMGATQLRYAASEVGDYMLIKTLLNTQAVSKNHIYVTRLNLLNQPVVSAVVNQIGVGELVTLTVNGVGQNNQLSWYRNGTLIDFCKPSMIANGSNNLLFNGNFDAYLFNGSWSILPTNNISMGWKSAANGIEIQQIFDGQNNYMELDANSNSVDRVWQEVKTVMGKVYQLSFDISARPSIPAENSSAVEVYFNNKLLDVITPNYKKFGWKRYTYQVPSELADNKIEFRELAIEDNSYGALIDNVSLVGNTEVYTSCDSVRQVNQSGVYKVMLTNLLGVNVTSTSFVLHPSFSVTATTLPYLYAASVVTLTLVSNDGSLDDDYVYQWYKDGVAIVNARAHTYGVTEAGDYRLVRTLLGSSNSSTNFIHIERLPILTKPVIVCNKPLVDVNAPTQLLTSSDYRNNIEWYKNGVLVAQGIVASLFTVTHAGYYKVKFTNPLGMVVESNDFLVHTAFSITSTTLPYLYFSDKVKLKQVAFDGSLDAIYSYQWYKNGLLLTEDATLTTYDVLKAGTYTLVRTYGNFTLSSTNNITVEQLALIAKPIIVANTSVLQQTSSVVLQAKYTGNNQVQWYKDGFAIQGANDTLYVAKEGGVYKVTAFNVLGYAQDSDNFLLHEQFTITATIAPYVAVTRVVKLKIVTACGQCPATTVAYQYQWYRNGVVIEGAVCAEYDAKEAGIYTLKRSFLGVELMSLNFVQIKDVLMMQQSVITASPSILTVNQTATLTASHTDETMQIQWYKDGVLLVSAMDSVYRAQSPGLYKVKTTNLLGISLESDLFVLHRSFTITATNGSVMYGNAGLVTLTLVGVDTNTDALFSYQWYRNGVVIPNANAVTYVASTTGTYNLVRSLSGSSLSSTLSIQVINWSSVEPLVINSITPLAVVRGQLLTIVGTGFYAPVTVSFGGVVLSATVQDSKNMIVQLPSSLDNVIADLKLINAFGDIVSRIMVVHPSFTITSTTAPLLYGSATVKLKVSSQDTAFDDLFTYQWYKDGRLISNATQSSYEVFVPGEYYLVRSLVSSTLRSIETITVSTLPLLTKPLITALNHVIPFGASMTLTTSSTGNQLQWYRDGQLIAGAVSTKYAATLAGNYTVVATNLLGLNIQSESFVLSQSEVPVTVSLTYNGSLTLCSGDQLVVNTTISSTTALNAIAYQWYRDGEMIVNATGNQYNIRQSGSYTVAIATSMGVFTATAIQVNFLTVNNAAFITTENGQRGVIAGQSLSMTVNIGDGTQYSWKTAGSLLIGQNTPSIIATPQQSQTYEVQFFANDYCYRASIDINVLDPSEIEESGLSSSNLYSLQTGVFTVKMVEDGIDGEIELLVVDSITGNIMYQNPRYKNDWSFASTPTLHSGTYYYRLTYKNSNGVTVKKINYFTLIE